VRPKAAIVTFSRNVNYGGALQEFALYTVVKETFDTVCVDYYDPMIRANSDVIRHGLLTGGLMVLKLIVFRLRKKNAGIKAAPSGDRPRSLLKSLRAYSKEGFNQLVLIISDTLNYRSRKELLRNYKEFWDRHVAYTPQYTQQELTAGACGGFDIFIAGSDQIWNPVKFGLSPVYFLSFVGSGVRKISYASSFGNFHFRDKQMSEKIKGYLSNFSWISVREEHSVSELRERCGIEARTALDPTLLLGKEKWMDTLGFTGEGTDEPYLLVYLLGNYRQNIAYAKQVARRLELPVRVLNQSPLADIFSRDHTRCTYFPSVGPDEFVRLFSRASFVVTDSFHGTAFSINFNIPFISIESRVPERIVSLLSPMGLMDRVVKVKAPQDISLDVDFTRANAVLESERERSLAGLMSAAGIKPETGK